MIQKFFLLVCFVFLTNFYGVAQESGQDSSTANVTEDWDTFEESGGEFIEINDASSHKRVKGKTEIFWLVGIILASVLAGIAVRYKTFRWLRWSLLVASLLFLGFFRGGCPCPISGLQSFALMLMGENKSWMSVTWFLALLPVVYFLGRIWCGWICHLGAFQEVLFRPRKLKLLKSVNSQRILYRVRVVLLIALIIQLLITHSNLFKEIDPFKAAFNLYSPNMVAWILLGLLVMSSIFIYRPFCRAVCPVGLIFGWIGKIKSSFHIEISDNCNECKRCTKVCEMNAIFGKKVKQEDCIVCGECIEQCKKRAIILPHTKEMPTELAGIS